MTAHRPIVAAGPGEVRRLCCGTGCAVDPAAAEMSRVALEAIDDPVALVGGRPIEVSSLWRTALASVACADRDGNREGLVVVHPSWWSRSRMDIVTAAACGMTEDSAGTAESVVVQPRSWLLAGAARVSAHSVIVEIAESLVVVQHCAPGGAIPETVAVPRRADAHPVVDEVMGVLAQLAGDVVIDGPGAVIGARALAASIAAGVRHNGTCVVREVDDAALARLARATWSSESRPAPAARAERSRSRRRAVAPLAAAGVVLAAAVPPFATPLRHGSVAVTAAPNEPPTTYLVEGRVALTIPADWATRRIVAGPGSARIQATSPSDPEVALHVTQSPASGETLTGTAEQLKKAIDAEPTGVFVDFDPAGSTAGRTAVTYREARGSHHVRWTVLLDGPVRISVGCQSRPGGEAAVRGACEQAVRSAHAVG